MRISGSGLQTVTPVVQGHRPLGLAFGNNGNTPDQFDKFDPASGRLLGSYPVTKKPAVDSAINQARQAFIQWQNVPPHKRAAVLKETARLIRENADDIARLISRETGKPLKESLESDILTAVNVLNFYARQGPKALADRRLPADRFTLLGRVSYERRVPYGVVGIISPWNYPFAIPVSGIAASLMGGNTAVLKPSELTPATGEKIGHLFQQALKNKGLPPEVVRVVTGDGATGKALVNADIDYMIFTGSARTGYAIRNALQARGIEASLELGGSDPMIILENADDLDAITSYALWGRFTNTGQTCAAVKRLFVPASRHEDVLSLLKEKIGQLRQGSPENPGHHVGPLLNEAQLREVDAQVKDAVARGARIVIGGKIRPGDGWYYEPTLLADVPPDARVMTEEVFGPVLPVAAYDTVDEAVRLANASPYGLTGSVFGPRREAEKIARQLHAGVVAVNDTGTTQYGTPAVTWQGWKQSGPGRSHGLHGLLETTRLQTVVKNYLFDVPLFRKQPWHFSKNGADLPFSESLVENFGGDSGRGILKLSFLRKLLRNRSSEKI